MKKIHLSLFAFVMIAMFFCTHASPQEGKSGETKDRLSSEKLDKEGRDLDSQIVNLCKKIEDVVRRYDLMKTKGIRILPYRTTYRLTDNYIEIERHDLEKDQLTRKITRTKTKMIRLYSTGQSVSKIESVIRERNYSAGFTMKVEITDNSPTAAGTDDIVFVQSLNGKISIDGKRLGDVKNTTAFPVRNDLKRDFLVPTLSYFYDLILDIAETYRKSIKDSDAMMYEFLRQSTDY